jgi:predicted nucleic acid-binding protein
VSVIVDTSAWVEYLRGTGSSCHVWVRDAIAEERPLGWTDPVMYELTAGARTADRAAELRALLFRGPMHPVSGLQDWEDASALHRTARRQGLTVRSSIDCLIAAVALRTGNHILTADRDFSALATISDLEIVPP